MSIKNPEDFIKQAEALLKETNKYYNGIEEQILDDFNEVFGDWYKSIMAKHGNVCLDQENDGFSQSKSLICHRMFDQLILDENLTQVEQQYKPIQNIINRHYGHIEANSFSVNLREAYAQCLCTPITVPKYTNTDDMTKVMPLRIN